VLVGFGNSPAFTEFSPDGDVLCDAHFGLAMIFEILDSGLVKSYRTFKSRWVGRPKESPVIKVKDGRSYISWNGATEVRSWRLQSADEVNAADEEFVTIQELKRDGFEPSFELDGVSEANVRIAELDGRRSVLAYSAVVSAISPTSVSFWQIMFFVCGFTGFGFLCWKYQGVLFLSSMLRKSSSLLNFRRWKTDKQSYELLESQE
jgi:hypothetical protein